MELEALVARLPEPVLQYKVLTGVFALLPTLQAEEVSVFVRDACERKQIQQLHLLLKSCPYVKMTLLIVFLITFFFLVTFLRAAYFPV